MAGHCSTCRYWSAMVARSELFTVQALCLSSTSPHASTYTSGGRTCAAWADAPHGPVDSPVLPEGAYPAEVTA